LASGEVLAQGLRARPGGDRNSAYVTRPTAEGGGEFTKTPHLGLTLVISQTTYREMSMPAFLSVLEGAISVGQQKREPTKLECGLLGALVASMVLAFFFWLGIQLSMLKLLVS
jgi:hypothetical protein